MIDDFVQAMILMLSAITAYLLASGKGSVRRWGYVVGIVGEPFWLYASWVTGQWGVVILALWWTVQYIRGCINNWEAA